MKRRSVMVLSDHYLPGYKAGGPIRSLAAMANLDIDGDVLFLTRDRDLGDRTAYQGIRVGAWGHSGSAKIMFLPSNQMRSVVRAWWQIVRLQPSCVYVNSLFAPSSGLLPLLLWNVGLLGRTRLVIAPRGQLDPGALTLSPRRKGLALRLLNTLHLLDRVRWQAESDLELGYIRALAGAAADIQVVTAMPELARRTQEPHRPHRPLQVVYVSRISPKKGLLIAIKALARVSVPVELDVYGLSDDLAYTAMCREAADALPQGLYVRFLGAIGHDEVFNVLQGADLFLLPTLGENFGHAILEALSAGCPVVIGSKTPWTAAVAAGAGAIVDPLDSSDVARAIDLLAAQSPEVWVQMSDAAVEAAAAHRNARGAASADWERLFWGGDYAGSGWQSF